MPSLDELARTLESATSTAVLVGRSLLQLDTNPVPDDWEHVTKIDPEDEKELPLLFPLYLQHTGALEVGGSQDVTGENTEKTLELVADRPTPAFQEPSGPSHVTDRTREQAAFLAIPEVLNGDAEALVGQLGAGIEHIKEELAPTMVAEKLPISPGAAVEERLADFAASWMLQEAVFEAYIIMNLDSAAAREGNVTEADLLDPEAAKHRAMAAERHLGSEIVYLEYSGTYGDEEAAEILRELDDGLTWSRLWYGGGLDDRDNAEAMLSAGADAVVVGDVFHDVAEEEVDICERALADLDYDASREAVADWIDREVDLADTSGARYLSTITDVRNPEKRAREYLLSTVRTRLALASVVERLDEGEPTSVAAIRSALDDATLPGVINVENVLEGEDLLRELLSGLLARRYGVEFDGPPVEQVSFDLGSE